MLIKVIIVSKIRELFLLLCISEFREFYHPIFAWLYFKIQYETILYLRLMLTFIVFIFW